MAGAALLVAALAPRVAHAEAPRLAYRIDAFVALRGSQPLRLEDRSAPARLLGAGRAGASQFAGVSGEIGGSGNGILWSALAVRYARGLDDVTTFYGAANAAPLRIDSAPTSSLDLCILACIGYATKDDGAWRFTFGGEWGFSEAWTTAHVGDVRGTVDAALFGNTRMLWRVDGAACFRAHEGAWLCASIAPALYLGQPTSAGVAVSLGVAHF